MTEIVRAIGLSVLGTAALAFLLVLPGIRLADRLAGPRRSVVARLVLSIAVSQVLLTLVGVVLVATGHFSGLLVAIAMAVLAATSLPVLARWIRRAGRPTGIPVAEAVMAALVIPWVAFVGAAGWPPADTLQWYYDGLGRQLAAAGGIPAAVAEWGLPVRWLPDYLVFNLDSEAYQAVLGFLPRADALAAWRVPVVLVCFVLLVGVLRLWVGRPPALVGAAVIAGSTFYLAKFDAYKPEALGIVLGLVALWLVVAGIRHERRSWVLLGGALLGIDLAVHAIAAAVMGLLVAGFAGGEWLGLTGRRWRALDWLVRAAALGLLVSVVLGAGLQGRAVVATGALNPSLVQHQDPTWTFFLRSTGQFDDPAPPPPQRPLAGGVTVPWPGLKITSAFGWWLLPVVAIGFLAFLALGGRKARRGGAGLVIGAGLVGVAIGFFALAFDTYVPRWTGLVRFGQYLPFVAGVGVTFGLAGYLRAWAWLTERRIPRRLALVAAVAGVAWLVPGALGRYAAEARIAPAGIAALEAARAAATPGDVVLANSLTTGTVESFTGLEDPFEGRQPLIEQPVFLAATNELLLAGHRWFEAPDDRAFVDRLGARWIIVADDPATLGASATLGGSLDAFDRVAWLRPAWKAEGIGLYEVRSPVTAAAVVDSVEPLVDLPRAIVVLAAGGLGLAVLVVPLSVARRRIRDLRGRRSAGADG